MHSRYAGVRWRREIFFPISTDRYHSRASQHRWRYFVLFSVLLLKLKDRRSSEFLAFIRPVGQWITRQWSFPPILLPWNAWFSLLLVLGKLLCARPATQLTCCPLLPANRVRQSIAHARKFKSKGSIPVRNWQYKSGFGSTGRNVTSEMTPLPWQCQYNTGIWIQSLSLSSSHPVGVHPSPDVLVKKKLSAFRPPWIKRRKKRVTGVKSGGAAKLYLWLKIWNWTRPRALVQNRHTRELISAQNT